MRTMNRVKLATLEVDDLPGAPPALMLMLREFDRGGGWEQVRRRIRESIRDIKDQSLDFERRNATRKEPLEPSRFEVHPHGALDILSGSGCVGLNCRVVASHRLARSFGLLADRIWLTDQLSTDAINLGRPTNHALDSLMEHAVVLAPLIPLIQAGVIGFRSPWTSACKSCADEFESQVAAAAKAVVKTFQRQVVLKRDDDGRLLVQTGNFFDPSVVFAQIDDDAPSAPMRLRYAELLIDTEVRGILWTAQEAARTGGAVISNSRVGLAGLLQCEGRLPRTGREFRVFEANRSLDLPWVSELDPTQILQLRDEASDAIPRLRELLARAISPQDGQSSSVAIADALAELRDQAAEVRAELSVKQRTSARYWKVVFGLLGLGLSAYGVAHDQVLPGVGGLLPILQLLIAHKSGYESELEKLKTRPGYVLVRAQDILAHEH